MNEPIPNEGIAPGQPPTVRPAPDAIAPGAPPPAPDKSPYDRDDANMPSLARPGAEAGAGMQSLAQSARGGQLRSARATMLVVGVLTLAVNGFFYWTNMDVPAEFRNQEFDIIQMTNLGFAALGVIFIILGLAVKSSPVPCTTAALVLYVVAWVASGALDPIHLASGIIFKIIITVGLFNAVKAARAYEAEMRRDEMMA